MPAGPIVGADERREISGGRLELVPVDLRAAKVFVLKHHRHNDPPHAWKFGVGVARSGVLVGVATAARPSARELDNGATIEVQRTCTDGTRNANSMLYGAIWRAACALRFRRGYTYTQEGESGASLLAAGWRIDAYLPARGDWSESSVKLKHLRDPAQISLIDDRRRTGGVARVRWVREC